MESNNTLQTTDLTQPLVETLEKDPLAQSMPEQSIEEESSSEQPMEENSPEQFEQLQQEFEAEYQNSLNDYQAKVSEYRRTIEVLNNQLENNQRLFEQSKQQVEEDKREFERLKEEGLLTAEEVELYEQNFAEAEKYIEANELQFIQTQEQIKSEIEKFKSQIEQVKENFLEINPNEEFNFDLDQEPQADITYDSAIQFTDVTESAGIEWSRQRGDEAFSVSWTDYNNDGLADLWINGHGYNGISANSLFGQDRAKHPLLYINNGDGTFTNLFEEDPRKGSGGDIHVATLVDYDNDGDADAFAAAGGELGKDGAEGQPNILFNNRFNDLGIITNVAEETGVEYALGRTRSSIWFDANNDGLLDFVNLVANREDGEAPNAYFEQQADGTFIEKTDVVNLNVGLGEMPGTPVAPSDSHLSACCCTDCGGSRYGQLADLTGDGKLELIIHGTYQFPLAIYDISSGGEFKNITDQFNVPFTSDVPDNPSEDFQEHESARDSVIADFNGDGYNDVFLVRSLAKTTVNPSVYQGSNEKLVAADLILREPGTEIGYSFQTGSDAQIAIDFFDLNGLQAKINPKTEIFIGAEGRSVTAEELEAFVTLNSKTTQAAVANSTEKYAPVAAFLLSADSEGVEGLPEDRSARGAYVGLVNGVWQIRINSDESESIRSAVESTEAITNLQSIGFINTNPADNALTDQLWIYDKATGEFVETSESAGLSLPTLAQNVVSGDFDNDKDIDLYLVNSYTTFDQGNILYENQGDGTFKTVFEAGGAEGNSLGFGWLDFEVGARAAVADYDQDGTLDIFLGSTVGRSPRKTYLATPSQLFKGESSGNNWIQINLEGTQSNRDAIGAQVRVTSGGTTQLREQNGGTHHFAQNSQVLHFGLAQDEIIDKIEIRWPSGVVQVLEDVAVNQILNVTESFANTTNGTNENNTLDGSDTADQINALAGDDTVNALAGNDNVTGGEGADSIMGGAGNDTINGETGNDTLSGGTGNDSLLGGDNDDVLNGNEGDDTLEGNDGNDQLNGGEGFDYLVGGAETDTINGDAGDDLIEGGDGQDNLSGGEGNDTIDGGSDSDEIFGDDVNDSLVGENDSLANEDDSLVEENESLVDEDDSLVDEDESLVDENDSLVGGNDSLIGGEGNDTLWGGIGKDTIDGGEGNDSLEGQQGSDLLVGGRDNDTLTGGEGADTLIGDEYDSLVEAEDTLSGEAGKDLPPAAEEGAVPAEEVIDSSPAAEEGAVPAEEGNGLPPAAEEGAVPAEEGNDLPVGGDDSLFGDDGSDLIIGGEGNDTLRGGNGNDTLRGGNGSDLILEEGDLNFTLTRDQDTGDGLLIKSAELIDLESIDLQSPEIDVDTFSEIESAKIVGGGKANVLNAEDANISVILEGGGGNDELIGGSGDDELKGDVGKDILTGGVGNDILEGGNDADILTGGDNADILNGGDGADNLTGGDGADSLTGGAGPDILTGGADADKFIYTALNQGVDTITDFTPGEDVLVFSAEAFGGGLTPGVLDENQFFVIGSSGTQDTDVRFLYNPSNGRFLYDADGAGGSAPKPIATLEGMPSNLEFTDIEIID